MATFKVMVRKDRRKVDKSYVVYIRFTHNRRTTYLPTSMVAERGDLTSSLKIKNWRILDRGEELIRVIGVDGLQFYCARHSMATIAVNEVRIPIYTVNDMRCHVDEGLRVTNLYVKKDFSLVNEANVRLMEYVFGAK